MRLKEFEARAWQVWEEIPEHYKQGVDGLIVSRDAKPHPELPDIYTLGECLTEAYPSDFGGPETIRSAVVLYHGSFDALADLDEEFDWDAELWETLTHELRHHLESLAAEDALEDVDYAADENFRRLEGEPFDPFFYHSGEPAGVGLWRVEDEFFLEREYTDEPELPEWLEFEWRARRYRIARPEALGDVCFLWIEEGMDLTAEELTLVLVRRRGFGRSLRLLLRREPLDVVEVEGVAQPLDA